MADFDPDTYIAEKSDQFDPDKYLAEKQPPQEPIIPRSGAQTESLEAREFLRTSPDQVRGTGEQPIVSIPRIPQQQGVLAQLGAGAVNAASGLAEMAATPMTYAALPVAPLKLTQILFGGQALSDIKTAYEEAARPETTVQRGLELGGRAVADALMGVGLVKGATAPRLSETLSPILRTEEVSPTAATEREVIPNASEITSPTGIAQREIRPPVGEEAPLRQQGETPEARQGTQAQPEVPQKPIATAPEAFPSISHSAEDARRAELRQLPPEGTAVPQPEQSYSAYPALTSEDITKLDSMTIEQANNEAASAMKKRDDLIKSGTTQGSEEYQRANDYASAVLDKAQQGGLPVSTEGEASTALGQPKESGVETPTTTGEVTQKGQASVPEFARRYDQETFLSRPTWVEPGSVLDKQLGLARELPDTHSHTGANIKPIWDSLTPTQRQDLIARGWKVEGTRDPRELVLGMQSDSFPARRYFSMQTQQALKPSSVSEQGQAPSVSTQPKEIGVTPQGQAAPEITRPVAAEAAPPEPPIIGKDVTKDIPDFPRDQTVGLTQDFISKDREARGEEPLAKQARQTNPETWDKSAQVFQENPNSGHELVADLVRNPRPISQDDLGVLLRHRVNLTNETDLHYQRLTDPNATPQQKGDALIKLSALRDARNDADTAVQTQGSTTGRTLQFLKSLSDQDYSLSGIGQQRTAAMGGKEMAPVELEKFNKENTEWSREILEKDAALQNYLKTNARQESALKAYKTRLKTATTETERRIAFSDYAPEIRRQMELDPEAVKLKGEADAVKQRFQEQLLKDELANRPWWQKVLGGVAWAARESALSGYHTLEKLAGFTGGQLVRIPLTQAAERVWGIIPGFKDISAQSEFGPGASAQALGKLYSTFFRTAMDQAKKVLTTGKGDYTMQYEDGKRPMQYPSFFGRLHGLEKYPLREASTEMNRQRIIDKTMADLSSKAVAEGHDITDPVVQGAINKLASDAGARDILMNNNLFADKINGLLSAMEGKQKATGEPSVELNVMSALAKTFLTKGIVRTPANFVTQVFEHTPIGLARGLAKGSRAIYKGVESVPPAQRTAIMRLLGAGSVGSGMFLWGALDALRPPDQRIFGGYYQPGEKRDGNDVKFASVRLDGVTAPHYLTHNLLSEPAQMGNTLMRVATSALSKKDRTNKGLVAGALASTLGLAEQAPIANPAFRMGKLTDPRQQTGYFADLVRGLIPQLIQNIAMDMDKSDAQRKPSGLVDTLKLGIPGLRQTVPEKVKKSKISIQ